ncbi:hypothetical protein DUNSADRAFT_1563 [Dunaliella salina]|uniref:Uncharacterized protein n=1 Tax=Dunaliella salina TaxID=3046 RepID=A0ABQ7FXA1_DUNSA|nr:hypothetical protein DUNSADRAFT_1563 [Dunaliella salina]|eukprot:KAF5826982.1 hypothetical protein DUNSADRAFT_1563 [Dunaliella salina]
MLEGWLCGDLQPLVSALANPAGVRILHVDDARPQAVSNIVWALANFKFYDEGLYSVMSNALLEKHERCIGHDLSNLFYSCAEAQHWDSSMDKLAELISKRSYEQWGTWESQYNLFLGRAGSCGCCSSFYKLCKHGSAALQASNKQGSAPFHGPWTQATFLGSSSRSTCGAAWGRPVSEQCATSSLSCVL